MISKVIPINKVNHSEYIYIQRNDTYNNKPLTGLGFSSSGLKAYYCRKEFAGVGITLRSHSAGDPWFSGGFVELDSTNLPGYYRIDVPNEVFSSGYVDDITISCDYNLFDSDFIAKMEQLILEGRISVNNEPAHIGQRIQFDQSFGYFFGTIN